jgi:hypothetical protein
MPLSIFMVGIVSVMTRLPSVRCGKWRSGAENTRPLRLLDSCSVKKSTSATKLKDRRGAGCDAQRRGGRCTIVATTISVSGIASGRWLK